MFELQKSGTQRGALTLLVDGEKATVQLLDAFIDAVGPLAYGPKIALMLSRVPVKHVPVVAPSREAKTQE